jgi:iron complex outermembrane receptor protein
VNAETSYRLGDGLALRLRVENVFDREYATAGLLGDASDVFPSFSDPRFETPGRPRSEFLELQASF